MQMPLSVPTASVLPRLRTVPIKKIPQTGNVVVEENVEIGANTVIDRATMGSTIIRKGVKLDNLIQVAHNVEIRGGIPSLQPRLELPVLQKIGRGCQFGGQVGIIGHATIADGVQIGAQAGSAGQRKARKGDIVGNSGDRLHGVYEGLCFIP